MDSAPEVYSTAMQNITGHPALTVPFGHLPSGLPFGLQITAEHYRDEALLDVAAIFEREYPWRRTAPGYETLDTALDLGVADVRRGTYVKHWRGVRTSLICRRR